MRKQTSSIIHCCYNYYIRLKFSVVGESTEYFQHIELVEEFASTKFLLNEAAEIRVARQQPTTRGNSIGNLVIIKEKVIRQTNRWIDG